MQSDILTIPTSSNNEDPTAMLKTLTKISCILVKLLQKCNPCQLLALLEMKICGEGVNQYTHDKMKKLKGKIVLYQVI